MITVTDAKAKIASCIFSCETTKQLASCQRMIDNIVLLYKLDCVEKESMEYLVEEREQELMAGQCQKCEEPINNAEYDLCPKCMAEVDEYWGDVQSETGLPVHHC